MGPPLKTHDHTFFLVQTQIPVCGDSLQGSDVSLAQLGEMGNAYAVGWSGLRFFFNCTHALPS